MNSRSTIIVGLLIAFFFQSLPAQNRFRGGIVAGFNAAQLDGDASAGYHKVGLSVGLRALIELKKRLDITTELLFSQRGSRTTENQSFTNRTCTTHYIEVPVLLNIRDWKKLEGTSDEYYKVSLSIGLSYGRLFKVTSSPDFTHALVLDKFNNNDISFVGGVNYQMNRHWGFSGRISKSINLLFNPNKYPNEPLAGSINGLRGHYLTFQSSWIF